MQFDLDYILKLWPVGIAFVGLVAWLVKVDGRTIKTAKDLERVERESAEEVMRLEGRIDTRRREDMARIDLSLGVIMADIKTLLSRGKE